MSWVTIIWAMVASACLTLAVMHFGVWWRNREAWASLAFAVAALAVAGIDAGEFLIMRSRTPEEIGAVMRWIDVPLLVLVAALVAFVQLSFRTGRAWLGWVAVALRFLALVLNFTSGTTDSYREITAVRQIDVLGEPVSVVAAAVVNPWRYVGELSMLLLLVFVVEASARLWLAGGSEARRRASVIGGSVAGFVLLSSVFSALIENRVILAPYLISLPFLAIVLVMNYELGRDLIRATQLSEDLRQSEERMTLAAEAAGIGVWMWSIVRNEIWGSERWLRLFGFAPDAAVSFEKVIQRIHPGDREMVERDMRRALEDRVDYSKEHRVVLPDGTQRWIVSRGRMYPDAHGKPVRMAGVAIDITERKRIEEALRAVEEHYRVLFERANDGIFVLSVDGTLVSVNESFARMHGYAAKDMVGVNLSSLDVPETSRLAPERMRRILAGETMFFEVEHYHKDGHVFPLEVSASRIGIAGRYYIQCLHRDITERKRVEEALRADEVRLRSVIESTADGMVVVDLDGRVIIQNARFAEMWRIPGNSPTTRDGRALLRHVLGQLSDPEDFLGKMRAIYGTDAEDLGELRFKDGRIFERFSRPLVLQGAVAGRVWSFRDITAHRRSEQEIAQQRNQLAHFSRVSMLGELAGSLAHELNQPLTAILSNAQAAQRFLAHDEADLDEVRDILADIVAQDVRADEVIRRLRLLLKKGEVQRRSLGVNAIVAEALTLLRSDLLNHEVTVQTELAPNLPAVLCDRVQLQQVLLNLLMNACDAMAGVTPEGRRLVISTEPAGAAAVRISVADCGEGIAPDKMDEVFDPFYTTKGHGLGMGLAICRTIIEAHDGRLWATNNPERGATFHCTLPVSAGEPGADQTP